MKPCCENLGNRADGPGPRGGAVPGKNVTVTHCRVCECRHYEVTVEPGKLGAQGAPL